MSGQNHVIEADDAKTLHGLFRLRVKRTPNAVAFRHFNGVTQAWEDLSWSDVARQVDRWAAALEKEGLMPGDRVAVMMRNCPNWVIFEQAALSLGLVVVPLYANDRADNVVYISQNAGVKLLLIENHEQWAELGPALAAVANAPKVIIVDAHAAPDARLQVVDEWLETGRSAPEAPPMDADPNDLATIVYTSGTLGRPKGVMLTHRNILWNADSALQVFSVGLDDLFLSFLPLSHTFERTIGYYAPMMAGCTIAYSRSIPQLAEDLQNLRPTTLISVPRIYERVYNRLQNQLETASPVARKLFSMAVDIGFHRFERSQGRASWSPKELLWPLLDKLVASKVRNRLGGRLRLAVCGGAPLPLAVEQTFLGLGIPVYKGYGLTEASPVVAANPPAANRTGSIGIPMPGVETRISAEGELLTRSPSVMLGYWQLPEATAMAIDADGWLHTGDLARQDGKHLFITGRIKEILVLANGEKVPPVDMEMALTLDPLFEQAVVIGEQKPFLSAVLVLNPERWSALAAELGKDPTDTAVLEESGIVSMLQKRAAKCLHDFPGYAQIRRVTATLEPWTVENGLLTASLKMCRPKVLTCYAEAIEEMYKGH